MRSTWCSLLGFFFNDNIPTLSSEQLLTSPGPVRPQPFLLAGLRVLCAIATGAQGGGQGGAGGGAAGALPAGDCHGGQVGQAARGRHRLVTEADGVLVEVHEA